MPINRPRSTKRTSKKSPSNLHVIDHPLTQHLLTELRQKETGTERFRFVLSQLGELLAYEATRDLKLASVPVTTPMEKTQGKRFAERLTIVPILRAGLGMASGMVQLLPEARVGHLGIFRDEKSLQPVHYYEKLPPTVHDGPVLLVDPMLATGGSVVGAMRLLTARKCQDIRLICLLASPEGVALVSKEFPKLPIYTAALDRQLNAKGYILPGLGDAGDRQFGTG